MRLGGGKPKPQQTRRSRLRSESDESIPKNYAYGNTRQSPRRSIRREFDIQNKAEEARKLAKFWLQRAGLLALIFAVTASLINILTLSSDAKVMPLTSASSSSFLRPTSDYQKAASNILKSSLLNRNKVTINSGQIQKQLQEQFPELASVSVTLPLLSHRPIIYIEPTKPALLLVTRSATYVVDNTGKALVKGKDAKSLSQPTLPLLTDDSGLDIELNKQALPSDDVDFIREVIAQLGAKQYTVTKMSLPSATSELDARIDGQPYMVKFNLQSQTPREQAGTFLATINSLKSQNIIPSQYVDVRVAGRAYYQ